ncbi:MAG: hypothetical protein ACE5GL_10230 [Calditrichia bacterium]
MICLKDKLISCTFAFLLPGLFIVPGQIISQTAISAELPQDSYNTTEKSSDSSSTKNSKIFRSALVGSVILGISGAFIGYQTKTECAGSSDVLQVCSGEGHYAKVGAIVGGVSGTIIGYLSRRKEIKQHQPFFRIIIGSIAGGVAGFYLPMYLMDLARYFFLPLPHILSCICNQGKSCGCKIIMGNHT